MNDPKDSRLDQEFSLAIVAYLQKGRSSWPRTDVDAAKAVATSSEPDDVARRVVAIVRECLSVPVDWSSTTLSEGGDLARDEMELRHPELDPTALDALRWSFTYNWR